MVSPQVSTFNPGHVGGQVMQSQISVSVPEAVRLTGWSRSAIYEALKRQELSAKKAGRRTLILYTDLEAFMANLPTYHAGA